ncbi:uncharacterized protein LOC144470253 [Augochlora pura]
MSQDSAESLEDEATETGGRVLFCSGGDTKYDEEDKEEDEEESEEEVEEEAEEEVGEEEASSPRSTASRPALGTLAAPLVFDWPSSTTMVMVNGPWRGSPVRASTGNGSTPRESRKGRL